jgi:SAM-dependent methyltransferase/ribosomal protein S27AE
MTPQRQCPHCGVTSPVAENERVWPAGWQCALCGQTIPDWQDVPLLAPELADTVSGMNPENFPILAAVSPDHFWFTPRCRLLVSLIARYFPDAASLLEIGCGTGIVLQKIADMKPWRRLVGAELHPTGLREARRVLGGLVELVQMDARRIPARDAFDVIGAFDVIEHISDDEHVLTSMRETVRPGGGVVLAVPQHPFLWSEFDEVSYHERRYRRGELEAKLVHAGFEVVFSASYTVILFPAMVARRLLRRRPIPASTANAAGRTSDDGELRLPRWLNAVARTMLQAEVTLTLAGLHFPFGGSRVVVARKR